MTGLSLPKWNRPNYAIVSLLFSHFLYILFLFKFASKTRFLSYLVVAYICSILFETLLRSFNTNKANKNFSIWVPLAIANSTFINIDAVSIWGIVFAISFSILSKTFIVDLSGRHIFNPSIAGVVTAAVFFPTLVTSSLHSFPELYPANFLLIGFGLVTVILARTWMIGLTYHIGFYILYLAMDMIGINPWLEGTYDIGTKMLAQTTTGIIILTFGVISDPKTSPKGLLNQAAFGFTIALIDFILRENSVILSEALAYLGAQGIWTFKRDVLSKTKREVSIA